MSRRKRRELRTEMRKVLTSLDRRWVRAASGEVCSNLTRLFGELVDRRIQRVLAWSSFFPGEVDLTPFIAQQLDSGREVYLPRLISDHAMSFMSIGADWSDVSTPGSFGILEPSDSSGHVFVPSGCEDTLVLVPGLVFDEQGGRLGRGRGYYDRFLGQKGLETAVKVGVLWQLQLIDEVPMESHDIPMDWICHEEGFVKTSLEFGEDLEEDA